MTNLDQARDAFVQESSTDTECPAYDREQSLNEAHQLEAAAAKLKAAIQEFAVTLRRADYARTVRGYGWENIGSDPMDCVDDAVNAAIDSFAGRLNDEAIDLMRAAVEPVPAVAQVVA